MARCAIRQTTSLLAITVAALAFAGCGRSSPAAPTSATGAPSKSASLPLSALTTIAQAATLEQVAAGGTATSNNYLGQSVTIPGAASYDNIRFNWDGSIRTTPTAAAERGPIAAGTLFILTREYLGLPADLGASTPGYLAQSSSIEDGRYVLPASVTLTGGAKYWFYSVWTPGSAGSVSPITGFSEDTYAGGDMYIAPELGGSFPAQPFRMAPASWRVISFGPPVVYYTPPAGTCIDANFTLLGAAR